MILRVEFPGQVGVLEGQMMLPGGCELPPCVVVCHPHPRMGGNMNNNVVNAICSGLNSVGVAAFAFNFRGVGTSDGFYCDGVGEIQDVSSALDFVTTSLDVDGERIGLAGYSFGAKVALNAAIGYKNNAIKAISLVAGINKQVQSPCDFPENRPVQIIVGSDDTFLDRTDIDFIVARQTLNFRKDIVSGADHFFDGFEGHVGNLVGQFFKGLL